MTRDFSLFDKAQNKFYDLERTASVSEMTAVPEGAEGERLFSTASFAAAKLYRLGIERLLDLERRGIVHASTITGCSLLKAMDCIEAYFLSGKREFDRDEFEQLGRTCQSAGEVYKSKMNSSY